MGSPTIPASRLGIYCFDPGDLNGDVVESAAFIRQSNKSLASFFGGMVLKRRGYLSIINESVQAVTAKKIDISGRQGVVLEIDIQVGFNSHRTQQDIFLRMVAGILILDQPFANHLSNHGMIRGEAFQGMITQAI